MDYIHLATRRFDINIDYVRRNDLSDDKIWFRVMPFQQVAWYFQGINGYIIVSEIHWNLLLYSITGPCKDRLSCVKLMPSQTEDNGLILEFFLDKNEIRENRSPGLREISLICFLFLQNDLGSLTTNKLDVTMGNGSTIHEGMQTTLYWKGLYLDLYNSTVSVDGHKYIDPYDSGLEPSRRGVIVSYNDSLGTENNTVFIMESDTRLRKWKLSHPNAFIITSKKRSVTRCVKDFNMNPVGCHHMKSSQLQETGCFFDTVYITQQCFDQIKDLPRAKRYVMCLDDCSAIDKRQIDPHKLRIFGVSDSVISTIVKDDTGILFYFLVASILTDRKELKKEELSKLVSSFRSS